MQFKNPLFLLTLLILVMILLKTYYNMMKRKNDAPHLLISSKRLWGLSKNSFSPRLLSVFGYAISCAFFIIALARPQSSYQKLSHNVEGIDIMLILDISASMRIEDFRDMSRIDTAKIIIKEFIQGRISDKMGLEIFSGEPVTLIPPTLDYHLLSEALHNVNIGDIKDGTAIGDALAMAVAHLKESTSKSRVIILVTDGDSNMGRVDPLTGGELAKGYGIRVYSVAIGREGRVAMPFIHKDIFGRTIKTYQYFDSSINPELLRQISSLTNGKFYRVQDDPKIFREVFKDIDLLERRKMETTEQIKYNEQFMQFVKLGILSFFLTLLLQNTVWRVYP